MLTEKLLASQIERLLSLPFPPDETKKLKIFRDEYRRVLTRECGSDQHLVAVCDHVMNTATRCPPPSELYETATSVSAAAQQGVGCRQCDGTGWRMVKRRYGGSGTVAGYEAEFAERCDCA